MKGTKLDVVRTYFQAVDEGDFETVAEQFTEDCRYVHDARDLDIRGRDGVYEFFTQRGERDSVHRIQQATALGDDAVGLICRYEPGPDADDAEHDAQYLSFATVEDGQIAYYATGYLLDV